MIVVCMYSTNFFFFEALSMFDRAFQVTEQVSIKKEKLKNLIYKREREIYFNFKCKYITFCQMNKVKLLFAYNYC